MERIAHVSNNSANCARLLRLSCLLIICLTVANAAKDLCQFSKYKDSKSLEASKKKLSPLVGKTYTSQEGFKYQYTVGICAPVANGLKKPDLAVLQVAFDKQGKLNPNNTHEVGSLKDTHIMSGSDWVFLQYTAEEAYGTHCGSEKKQTAIMIACDENIGDNEARMVFIEEENQKSESCYYLFEMKHKAVCAVPSGGGGLSPGSIILIVFTCVAFVYLVVGFLYSRFVLGSKGKEQFPNYEFWKDFGNLQADGCDFVCRTKERRRSGGFGGIGDDQLDATEEVLRDDNLLPM